MNDGPVERAGWKEVVGSAPPEARVLVVDDEASIRRSLTKLVRRFGYEASTAESAEEADGMLADGHFDAVLLDIELPGMRGVDFLPHALEHDPEVAVIIITGLQDRQLARRCIDAGARCYLVKPVEAGVLELVLRDALAVRRVLVELNDAREKGCV